MTPLATAEDLAARLGRELGSAESEQADALLVDASAFLRGICGQEITAGTATFTAVLDAGQRLVALPQQPVRAVTAVLQADAEVSGWELVDGQLEVEPSCSRRRLRITFDYGYLQVPDELRAWTLVLASQALAAAAAHDSLGGPTVSQETIGQYSVSYSQSAEHSSTLPPAVLDTLRTRYGGGAHVTGA